MADQDITQKLRFKVETCSPSPPSAISLEKSTHTIKQRLIRHVKSRQEVTTATLEQDETGVPTKTDSHEMGKEKPRSKRPYNKRVADKSSNSHTKNGIVLVVPGGPVRKQYRKPKIKQMLVTDRISSVIQPLGSTATKSTLNLDVARSGFPGGEDDGSQDGNEGRFGHTTHREKEKCPGILAMVLSIKKRALLQNPTVQEFIYEVMKEIKR